MQKIIKAYPPNFNALSKVFPIKGQQGILYSWGDRIYNPSGLEIPPHLLVHEGVHGERQRSIMSIDPVVSTEMWWDHYIDDVVFRIIEEKYAHQAEWKAYNGSAPDLYLEGMVRRLSGPLYGNMVSSNQARDMILDIKTIDPIWSA